MFIRQKKNKSGVISIQIIDKSSGKYNVFKTIDSSKDIKKGCTTLYSGTTRE
jgi:hypothetical protein